MSGSFKTHYIPPNKKYGPIIYVENRPVTYMSLLGGGTYGEVYQGELNNFPIAIKRNIIEKSVDMIASIRELDILNACKHPFVVDLQAIFLGNPFKNYELPIITQYKVENGMMDLDNPIKIPAPNLKEDSIFFGFEAAAYDFQTLIYKCYDKSWAYIKKAMVQLLIAAKWLKAKGVIHRDLKPSNLLWVKDGSERFLKICDFGMSKHMYETGTRSHRVVTSWYRAPEISFGYPYSYPSDMWSIGCILYETITKKALNSGIIDNDVKLLENSLSLISEPPTKELVTRLNKLKLELDPKIYAPRRNLRDELNFYFNEQIRTNHYNYDFDKDGLGNKNQFIDLLNHILVLDPQTRYTPEQCLAHPFFKSFEGYIQQVEKIHPPVETKYEPINIVACKDRGRAAFLCYCIFDKRASIPWYKPQIIFHTLEIYDKYLTYLKRNNTPYYEVGATKEESSYEPESMCTFKVMICLYICIKYFTITKVIGSFKDIITEPFQSPEYLKIARDFESGLIINLLKYQIYRPTILEASDHYRMIPNESNIKYMLMYYGNLPDGTYNDYRELFPEYQKFENMKQQEKRMKLFMEQNNNNSSSSEGGVNNISDNGNNVGNNGGVNNIGNNTDNNIIFNFGSDNPIPNLTENKQNGNDNMSTEVKSPELSGGKNSTILSITKNPLLPKDRLIAVSSHHRMTVHTTQSRYTDGQTNSPGIAPEIIFPTQTK